MKHTLELQENLDIRQGEIVDLYRLENGEWQVKTKLEALFNAKAVIIATGTFLGGRVYIGDVSYESGPDGMFPATELSKALKKLDIPLEFNFLGYTDKRNYPNNDFWQIVSEVKNDVVIGLDAHNPNVYDDKENLERAKKYLKSLNITPLDKIEL